MCCVCVSCVRKLCVASPSCLIILYDSAPRISHSRLERLAWCQYIHTYKHAYNFFPFTDWLRPNSTRCALAPAWLKTKKSPGQGQRSMSNGQKLDFSDGVRTTFHLPTDCAQIASGVHRHQLGSRQRKFRFKVKGQGQMDQNLDFSDGVPHNLFIYRLTAQKLYHQVCIRTFHFCKSFHVDQDGVVFVFVFSVEIRFALKCVVR